MASSHRATQDKAQKKALMLQKQNEAVEMFKAGSSQKAIGEKIGVSTQTIANWLRKAGALKGRKKRGGRKGADASAFNVDDLDAAIAILQRVKKLKEIFG